MGVERQAKQILAANTNSNLAGTDCQLFLLQANTELGRYRLLPVVVVSNSRRQFIDRENFSGFLARERTQVC